MVKDDLVSYTYLGFLTGLKVDDIRYILNGKYVINKTFEDITFLISNENYMLDYFFSNKYAVLNKINDCIKNKKSLFYGREDILKDIKGILRPEGFLYILQKMTSQELNYFISLFFVLLDSFLTNYTQTQKRLTEERSFLNPWEYREVLKKELLNCINDEI